MITTDQTLIDKEIRARASGDLQSSALQGGLMGALFGFLFGAAAGMLNRSASGTLMGAVLGAVVGGAAAIPARNAIRDYALYCVSNNIRGVQVSAATQGLLWLGPVLGAAVGVWAAGNFSRHGLKLAAGAILAGVVASFVVPMVGQLAFPEDYSDHIAEHLGQSVLSSLLVGGLVGLGVAFAARPQPGESFA